MLGENILRHKNGQPSNAIQLSGNRKIEFKAGNNCVFDASLPDYRLLKIHL
jgi:hypothetical protein